METSWKLQDAKAQFSQLVNNAISVGPQHVTRRGKEVVVILSSKDYRDIISSKPTFKDFLLNCPKMDDEFEFERQKDYFKDVEF